MAWRERLFVGSTPVTPSAFEIGFALVSQRFSPDVVFSAGWGDELVHKDEDPGLVEVELPQGVSDGLRRGSYMYSITATNLATATVTTVRSGYLLVEYKPTSPHKDIPYDGDGSLTGVGWTGMPSLYRVTDMTLNGNDTWRPVASGDMLQVTVEGDYELEILDPADTTVPMHVLIVLVQGTTVGSQVTLTGNLASQWGGVPLDTIQSTNEGAVDLLQFQWVVSASFWAMVDGKFDLSLLGPNPAL